MSDINPTVAQWPNRRVAIAPERIALVCRHDAEAEETWTCSGAPAMYQRTAVQDTGGLPEALQPRLMRYKRRKCMQLVARSPRNGAAEIDRPALHARLGVAAADRKGSGP